MTKRKDIFIKIHIYLIIFILVNLIVKSFFNISLNSQLIFALKIILYLSGVILFFLNLKPFRKALLYYSLYFISPILIFLGWLADGIFGAIVGSIFLFFFGPSEHKFQNNEIKIYRQFQGFMGSCCTYEVIKKEFFIFDRKVTEFEFENPDFNKIDLKIRKDTIYLHFILKDYDLNEDHYIAKDSIIKLNLK